MSSWKGQLREKRKDLAYANVMLELQQQVASLALAMEAVDTLLNEKGILKDNEILDKMRFLADQKAKEVKNAISDSAGSNTNILADQEPSIIADREPGIILA